MNIRIYINSIINKFKNYINNNLYNLLFISVILNCLFIFIIYDINFYKLLINKFFFYLINNLTLSNINIIIFNNKYMFIFLFFIWLGLCFDRRFTLKRKILLPFYFFSFIIILFFMKNHSFLWKEIFWYTLVINGAFIFHVLLLDWLYLFALKYKFEYFAFIITRISFFFSLSFIVYLLHLAYLHLGYSQINKNYIYLSEFIAIVINSLLLVLIYFINVFTDYSLVIQGKKKIKFNLNYIFFFFFTLFISYYLLGIFRIYFIWIYLMCNYLFTLIERFPLTFLKSMLLNILMSDFSRSIMYLFDNYNKVNSKNFTYGFIEFIDYTRTITSPSLTFHIKCPFYFYKRDFFILTYIRSYFIIDIVNKDINNTNKITKDTYDFVLHNLIYTFDINDKELDFYKSKMKKIYKNHLWTIDY